MADQPPASGRSPVKRVVIVIAAILTIIWLVLLVRVISHLL
jgi:hypothetical protein